MNFVIELMGYLCECITVLLCIHSFLGEKIKLEYKTVICSIVFTLNIVIIDYFDVSRVWTFIDQIYVFLYIWWRFKLDWIKNVILVLLNLIMVTVAQTIALIPFAIFFYNVKDPSLIVLIINMIAMLVMSLLVYFIRLNRLYIKIIKWDKKIFKGLITCAMLFIALMVEYKLNYEIDILSYTISAFLVCIVIGVLFEWQRDRYEAKQKSLELHMQELYGKTVEGMIENIRIRQHDFKNQLAAIYGMHLTAKTFDELVESQKKYCDNLIEDSRYDSILTKCKDRVLAGFLYTKFSNAEKMGVVVEYEVMVNKLDYKLATHEIVEIIGILVDNAVEYEVENKKGESIYFYIFDDGNVLKISCRNRADYISMESLSGFFKKGFTTKGDSRGLGLYNLKKMLEDTGQIIVGNKEINEKNWLEFDIEIQKE